MIDTCGIQRLCSVSRGTCTITRGCRMRHHQIPLHPTAEGRYWWYVSSEKDLCDTYLEILQWWTYSEPSSDLRLGPRSSQTLGTRRCRCLWRWWRGSPAGRWPSPVSPALCGRGYWVPHRRHPVVQCQPDPCQPRTLAVSGSTGSATSSQTGDFQLRLPCRQALVPLLPTQLAARSGYTRPHFLLWITG